MSCSSVKIPVLSMVSLLKPIRVWNSCSGASSWSSSVVKCAFPPYYWRYCSFGIYFQYAQGKEKTLMVLLRRVYFIQLCPPHVEECLQFGLGTGLAWGLSNWVQSGLGSSKLNQAEWSRQTVLMLGFRSLRMGCPEPAWSIPGMDRMTDARQGPDDECPARSRMMKVPGTDRMKLRMRARWRVLIGCGDILVNMFLRAVEAIFVNNPKVILV